MKGFTPSRQSDVNVIGKIMHHPYHTILHVYILTTEFLYTDCIIGKIADSNYVGFSAVALTSDRSSSNLAIG